MDTSPGVSAVVTVDITTGGSPIIRDVSVRLSMFVINPYNANFFVYTIETEGFVQFEIIRNILVSSF